MWIPFGVTSGGKANPSIALTQRIAACSVTVRPSGGYNVNLVQSVSNKFVANALVDHPDLTLTCGSSNNLLISASAEGWDVPFSNDFSVDTVEHPEWTIVNNNPSELNSLAMGYYESPSVGSVTVDYDHFLNLHDSVDWMAEYTDPSGSLSVVGSTAVNPTLSSSVVVPLHGSSLVNDWVIVAVMHRIPLVPPSGGTLDFTDRILGTSIMISTIAAQTTLSIFRKKLTADDISNGSITISVLGA